MDAADSAKVLLRLGAAFRADTDQDVLVVWHQQIGHLDYELGQEAADRCIRSCDRFPTVSQFVEAAQGIMRERARAGAARKAHGLPECEECDGSRWVDLDGGNPPAVRPCSRCEPAMYERWRGGHFMSHHDAYSCDDDGCHDRSHGRRRVGAR